MINIFIDKKKILSVLFLLFAGYFYSQVRIANYTAITSAVNSSAFIDASSSNSYNLAPNLGKGLLYPRTDLTLFTTFGVGTSAGIPTNYPSRYDGFMVYNTASSGVAGVGVTEGTLCRGFWYYDNASNTINGGTWRPLRPELCSTTTPPIVSTLNCGSSSITGTLTQSMAASGVSVSVPYTGGNGAAYTSQSVNSTGVTDLTATLQAGTLANGNGNITYTISGTPTSSGTASFNINIGGQTCTLNITVQPATALVTSLNCGNVSLNGTLVSGQNALITLTEGEIPYIGGNGVAYPSQNFISTNMPSLTLRLYNGTLANGTGKFTFYITGTPTTSGLASFNISIAGAACTLNIPVESGGAVVTSLNCGAGDLTGNLIEGRDTDSGVSVSVPYTGGNGAAYTSQSVSSTGVAGLTATLDAGNVATGNGNLVYAISGTPTSSGTASFNISIGGQTCTFTIPVSPPGFTGTTCNGNIRYTGTLRGNQYSDIRIYKKYPAGMSGNYVGRAATSNDIYNNGSSDKGTLKMGLNSGTYNPAGGEFEFFVMGIPGAPTPLNAGEPGLFFFLVGPSGFSDTCNLSLRILP